MAINISGIEIHHSIFNRFTSRGVHYITNSNTVYWPQSPINISAQGKTFNYQERYGVDIELDRGVSDNTGYWFMPNSHVIISINIIADEYDESLVKFIDSYWSLNTNNQAVRDFDLIGAAYNSDNLHFQFMIEPYSNLSLSQCADLSFTANAKYTILFAYDSIQYELTWDAYFTTDFSF